MDATVLMTVMAVLLFTFLGIFAASYVMLGRLNPLEDRFRQLRVEHEGSPVLWREYLAKLREFLTQLGGMIPRSPEEMSRQQKRLVQAGIRHKGAPTVFLGLQGALAVILFLVFSAIVGTNVFLSVILSIFLGALLPDIWLSLRVRKRKQAIQLSLPDALDLLVVCVEAGLGLDQSLMRIGQEIRVGYPELSDELHILNLELNAGTSRTVALRHLGQRSEVEDLKALVAVLIQTDRFGTSIADSLRVFSDTFRTKRRQRAEEHAAKMGVKMIPPLFLFVLPATFAVIVGPAVIMIAHGLLPMLRGEGP